MVSDGWRSALAAVGSRVAGPPLDRRLRVTVHFHPDRRVGDRSLLDHLAEDGYYRSQFETGTSNGGLTAYPGGPRWHWEHRLFDGAYNDQPDAARPKYGSLNHRCRSEGGSIRFGSAHLRLREQLLDRSTFCYPDSVFEPTELGTAEQFPLIEIADADRRDLLDDYIEAHVHGELRLDRDVEGLVLDPAYRGTDVEQAARRLPFPVEWHGGFRLHLDQLATHADYRGATTVDVGRDVAVDRWIDAAAIGSAVRRQRHDPQLLKRLWHCVARFGTPARVVG